MMEQSAEGNQHQQQQQHQLKKRKLGTTFQIVNEASTNLLG